MDDLRIDWLHRLGIDVWKLRGQRHTSAQLHKDVESEQAPLQRESRPQLVSHSAPNHIERNDPSIGPNSPSVSHDSDRHDETGTPPSIETRKEDQHQVTIEVRCITSGDVLAVLDLNATQHTEVYRGIVLALARYQHSEQGQIDFKWPPGPTGTSGNLPEQGDIDSARRAFGSMLNRNQWKPRILCIAGEDADLIAGSLELSDVQVLRISDSPSDSESKRLLWQQIESMC